MIRHIEGEFFKDIHDLTQKVVMQTIKLIGVVGAGQMGRGIAQVAIQSGYEVLLFDAFPNALDFGADFIKGQLAKGVEKKKWSQSDADQAFARLK